jgi:2-polyprenyl-6-methoxyphenol hydroxylase-like FAD-dependent oxidoreductase
MGAGLSPYPYALIFPQDEHEDLLISRLAEADVTVERRTELQDFEASADGIVARVKRPNGGVEKCAAAYLAGCDGAHSTVRENLNIGFPGGTYEHLFYVADVEASGRALNGEIHVGLDKTDFLAVFPLKDEGRARLVGTVRDIAEQQQGDLSWEDVSQRVIGWMDIDVARVNWFSTYHVYHRVADQFRKGRAFLLGDAAHIHSPVGGQGMNTGIGDAVNLAWKLAAVVQGRATTPLLDSYEPERIAFARRLVATTDQAFTGVTSSSVIAQFVRLQIVPFLFPLLFRSKALRRIMFGTVSQTALNYRGSRLSEGEAGMVQGGDRLPWVPGNGDADNYTPLTSLSWQVHVYGGASPELQAACQAQGLPLHVFSWRGDMNWVGLRCNAFYLVRPDGYIALAKADGSASALTSYLVARGILPNKGVRGEMRQLKASSHLPSNSK